MTSEEIVKMRGTTPGYWWVNVAPLGKKPDWREQPKPAGADSCAQFRYDAEQLSKRSREQKKVEGY